MTSYSANSTCMVLGLELHDPNFWHITGYGDLTAARTQQRRRMEVSLSHRGSFYVFLWPGILRIDACRPDTNQSMVSSKRLVHRAVSKILCGIYVRFG